MRGCLLVRWGAGLLVAVALLGCGKKGPPLSPERVAPAPVRDLAASLEGRSVRLTWTYPDRRADRAPLKDLAELRVYRREDPADAPQPKPAILEGEQVVGFQQMLAVELKNPAPARLVGHQVTFVDDKDLTFGRRYTYVVTSVSGRGRISVPSNRITVVLEPAPLAPADLRATEGDSQVRLGWQPPTTREDGSPVTGPLRYNIYRTTGPEDPRGVPLNPEPISDPMFVDLTARNDQTYYYRVLAVAGEETLLLMSGESAAVSATPEDQTAPAAPRNLVAVAAPGAVRLAWDAVPDPDLAGYIVYRSTVQGRGHEQITPQPLAATTFTDPTVRPRQTYFYVVTAVDRARKPNQSVPSNEARATTP